MQLSLIFLPDYTRFLRLLLTLNGQNSTNWLPVTRTNQPEKASANVAIDLTPVSTALYHGAKVLYIADTSQFNRMSRDEVLEGFAELIATCQYFCSPIIGEADAHKLIIQAPGDVGPALVSLGVFQMDQ